MDYNNHLDLHDTAKKIAKTGYFQKLTLKNGLLHFQYNNWQFNCYAKGLVTATLPESSTRLVPTFQSGYNQLGMVSSVNWLVHEEHITDNPDFCRRFALSYILG